MLCDICIGVLQHRANLISSEPGDDGPRTMCAHHRTTQTLETSAAEGCRICCAFWDQLAESEQKLLRIEESKALKKKEQRPNATQLNKDVGLQLEEDDYFEWLTFTILQRDPYYGGEYALMLMFSGDDIDWESVSARHTIALGVYVLQPVPVDMLQTPPSPLSCTTSSNESWATAEGWLELCLATHTTCNESQNNPLWYPTRLLDIGDIRCDNVPVRLVHSADEATLSGPYCTLSHCWGKAHFIQLNQQTTTSLRSGVALDQMPKTFREAISATKRLKVRYIWIDSLCIVQDDLSDWFREAAEMHKVYSHSYCNLSASASIDSSEGLFRSRNPQILQNSQVNVCVADVDPDHQYVECDMHDYFFWLNNVSHCTINKRGWVNQERLLAPRILHFGQHQLFWECREYDACESYPHGLPSLYKSQTNTNFKALNPAVYSDKMASRGQSVDPVVAAYQVWNSIVEGYSQTLLTMPGDKLIALSGLAKHMTNIVDDTYIVGMWRKYLESALLWHVNYQEKVDGSPSSRPAAYRAPSWSWASVDGIIRMGITSEQHLAIKVYDMKLKHATEDTTGVVTGGWLDLSGSLKPMRLRQIDNGVRKRWYIVIDDTFVRPQDESLEDYDRLGPNLHLDVPPSGDNAFDTDNAEQRLFFMTGRTPSEENEYIPILLLRLVDVENTVFERIGLAISGTGDGQEMLLAELEEEAKRKQPCLRYENGMHTIRII